MKVFALAACALVLPLAAAAGEIGRVTPIASMHVPRAVHTATALADGGVLVVGGCTTPGCELDASTGTLAETYDGVGRRFEPAGRLRQWRDDHTATLLRDGRVLIAGGWAVQGVTASSELYDPRTRAFSAGPSMGSRRAGATATSLRDGRVLITGGFTDNKPTVALAEVFVPKTGEFRLVAPMSTPRGAHAAARLNDGRVIVIGGLSRGRVVSTSELFNPRTGRFTRGPAMRLPRYKAAAVALVDGRVLVIGGSADIEGRRLYRSTEIYDPRRNQFMPGPTMRYARYKIRDSVVVLPDGDVLIAGGAVAPELLRRSSGRFTVVGGTLGSSRQFMTATRLRKREVLLLGGYDANISPTAQAWLYR